VQAGADIFIVIDDRDRWSSRQTFASAEKLEPSLWFSVSVAITLNIILKFASC
jgi:hypothetical protein